MKGRAWARVTGLDEIGGPQDTDSPGSREVREILPAC